MCWVAPPAGTATIEIWGAGGSGAEMCCCGFGIAGNRIFRKVITMAEGCSICAITGMPAETKTIYVLEVAVNQRKYVGLVMLVATVVCVLKVEWVVDHTVLQVTHHTVVL